MISKDLVTEKIKAIIIGKIPNIPYSITLSGSYGKKKSDQYSDFDFRIYYDADMPAQEVSILQGQIMLESSAYQHADLILDNVWIRSKAYIDSEIDLWLSGKGEKIEKTWTIWGYHILTDIYNQQIIDDPFGIASEWKKRLAPYPHVLKHYIIEKHLAFLKYWREDYHYHHKVIREDVVFLSALHAKLIHHIMQVLYALNEIYYPGDGFNLEYCQFFKIKPVFFEERVTDVLYPLTRDYQVIYTHMLDLIDDVIKLISVSSK